VANMDRSSRPPPVQVNIEGPSKVRLGHRDLDDGYEFTYIVALEGEYSVSIIYADQIHIPGSPFRPKFTSKSTECSAMVQYNTINKKLSYRRETARQLCPQ